jgi:hypothetical protein
MQVSGQLHAPDSLIAGEPVDNYWTEGRVFLRASLDMMAERKILVGNQTPIHGPRAGLQLRFLSLPFIFNLSFLGGLLSYPENGSKNFL